MNDAGIELTLTRKDVAVILEALDLAVRQQGLNAAVNVLPVATAIQSQTQKAKGENNE